MNRRRFATLVTGGALGLRAAQKTHIVTLSYDDGFRKSFYRIAEIHAKYGLRACLNVVATAHLPGRLSGSGGVPDAGIRCCPIGDFTDWNELKRRGHEVMAHSYNHAKLTELPLEEAKADIDRCADYFERHLAGFRAAESVYSFAYNASNDELDAHALRRFVAIRTRGRRA